MFLPAFLFSPMSRTQLGPLAAVAIVVLRVAIGLHFTSEGLDKLRGTRPFSSAGFLGNAKGPLAPLYKGLIFDPDGRRRLGMYEEVNELTGNVHVYTSPDEMVAYWTTYRDRVAHHYGFDEKQVEQTEKLLAKHTDRLENFFGDNADQIEEYYNQLKRRDQNATLPERRGLETLQTHDQRISGDWLKLRGQLLAKMDALWKNVETDLNNVATGEQREAAGGPLPIGKLQSRALSTDVVDAVIPWFDLTVGICLVLGLFTRTACVLAGLFLASVCASQWPGYAGADPIYYQSVEMLALFALAAVGAGKVASIDSLFCSCRRMCCPPKTAAQSRAAGVKS